MKIDLNKIMELEKIDKKDMANLLFPMNAHPAVALSRVLKGTSLLDEIQISRLAVHLDKTVGDLYDTGSWKREANKRIHTLTDSDGNKAVIDMNTMECKYYNKKGLIEQVMLIPSIISLDNLIIHLNTLKDNGYFTI